jgi:hypothetical protein
MWIKATLRYSEFYSDNALTPKMSQEQMVENLIAAFERMGIAVKRDVEINVGEADDDK